MLFSIERIIIILILRCVSIDLLVVRRNTFLPGRMLDYLDDRTKKSMKKYENMEELITNSQTRLDFGSPSWYFGISHEMSEGAKNLSKEALRIETMAMTLIKTLNVSKIESISILNDEECTSNYEGSLKNDEERCQIREKNHQHVYRTHSGKCNNNNHHNWGGALEAYARYLPAEYEDGISLPESKHLPSAREISLRIHYESPDSRHPHLMALTAFFAQFLTHDLSHTPRMELPDGTRLKCCHVEYSYFHPECFPIRTDDPVGCMEYSRSAPHPGTCKLGQRQQINQASSYLDASMVYGNSEELAGTLRTGRSGLLGTQRKNLPLPSRHPESCRNNNKAFPCFLSGDSRINEHPGIALMYVLFLRQHNKVAEELGRINPHWNDDKLYQEARRIVIAQLQHITYNEFLPVVLGESTMDEFNLRLKPRGYFQGYDSQLDATIFNSAASAGLFFVAILTPKTIDLVVDSPVTFKSGERSLFSAFYSPQEFYEAGGIDKLIVGLTAGHSRKPFPPRLDQIFFERYLNDGNGNYMPLDYVAQVVQQGRDHGLPKYLKWRRYCGLNEIREFSGLRGMMAKDTIDRLRTVYRKVEDVDLVTGALAEAPVVDSVMGPTFLCLLGHVFKNIRFGDRYWYENGDQPGSFTLQQLEEIRETTMASILCNNADRLKWIQPRAFILRDPFLNDMTNCSIYRTKDIDLSAWKEYNNSDI